MRILPVTGIVLCFCLIVAVPSPSKARQITPGDGMILPAVGPAAYSPQLNGNRTAKVINEDGNLTVSRAAAAAADERYVLKTAMSLEGKKYKYGGSGPETFDCSGFTMYVYGRAGISLPHNAASQFNYGAPVSREELQPGDLVFFSYYGGGSIQHVGIYTGSNNFIHASSSLKKVVTSSMEGQYYQNNYKGARRVLR